MATNVLHIYFAASIRAGRGDAGIYAKLVDLLRNFGTVLTEHVGSSKLGIEGETDMSDKEIHDRDMAWLMKSDVLVAEVTQPSLGVGYEIGRALEHKKRILCLFRADSDKKLSAMVRGAEQKDLVTVVDYQEKELETIVKEYFKNVTK